MQLTGCAGAVIRDQHALVTGGAGGIGLEISKCLAREGAKAVSIFDISKQALDEASQLLSAGFKTKITTCVVDVTSSDTVAHAVQLAQQHNGQIDIVFANAGIGPCGQLLDASLEQFEKVMKINYFGVLYTIKAVLPAMIERRSGHIAVTNSIGAFMGAAGMPAYCASKFAVRGLLESLRLELLGSGVSLHIACPTFTDTAMVRDAQRETTPEMRAMFAAAVPRMMTASGVAHLFVKGLQKGQFIPSSPDSGADFLISSCLTPCSHRPHCLVVDMLLAPVYVLLHWLIKRKAEAATVNVLLRHRYTSSEASPRHRQMSLLPCILVVFAAAGLGWVCCSRL